MTLSQCASLIERGDPDRFAALLATPLPQRNRLVPLYAFNLEVARAPWISKEPMIAEIRLQFWREVVGDAAAGRVRAHEVAAPFATLVAETALPAEVLDQLIEARRWDIYRDPFEDEAAMDLYLERTGGALAWLACKALGAGPAVEPVARDAGWAAGLAGFLRAVPELEARGRVPLVDGRAAAVSALAQRGLDRLARARAARAVVPREVRPAFLPGWQSGALLGQVVASPSIVAAGQMGLSEFSRRGRLLWQAVSGRF